MTQPPLDFDAPVMALLQGDSLLDRMGRYFLAHPNVLIRHRELAAEFGCGGWRSRVSDLRHAPYYLDIQNRQWDVYDLAGKRYRMSAYIYRDGAEKGLTT